MPQALFDVFGGYSIEGKSHILQGTSAELGVRADTIAAPTASIYSDSTDGAFWIKVSTGNGNATDWKKLATEDYANSISTQLSWREPVVVNDKTTTTIPAPVGSPTATTTIDGETINDGDRVLFSAITGGDGKNVYIWTAATGSWTEDTNNESTGDTVFVTSGTHAGHVYSYNASSNWVQIDQSSAGTEVTNVSNFVGKASVGTGLPSYSTTNAVTNNTDLRTAIGALDGTLGDGDVTNTTGHVLTSDLSWNAGGTLSITGALEAINTGIGDRQYATNHYIADGETLSASLGKLDAAVNTIASGTGVGGGTITNKTNFFILTDDLTLNGGSLTLTDAVDNLNTQIGSRAYTDSLVLTDGQAITASLEALNIAIGSRDYTTGNVLTDNEAVGASLGKLNDAIGNRDYTTGYSLTDGASITASLDTLNLAIGNRDYTGANYLTTNQNVTASLIALDTAVQNAGQVVRNHINNATAGSPVEVLSAGAGKISAQWHLVIKEVATQKTNAMDVYAVTDGTTVDYTGGAVLRLNGGVDGFVYEVILDSGELKLRTTSTNSCNISATLVAAEQFS